MSRPRAYRTRGSAYANPVHPGDLPDPSVVRIGETYYAFVTSTEWAPLFPILRSTDLVTWTEIGAVFAERPAWAAGQFWAPAIHARADGGFALYYTARRRGGPLTIALATAPSPEGPWFDHGPLVGQEDGSIDATIATDDAGTWMIWKSDGNAVGRPTVLWAQRLTADGLALEGERYEVLRNDCAWEDDVVEAPSVLARDGWFYLFYSGNTCCGEDAEYAVGVARARSIAGPWEKCPRNPILAANGDFRAPGHGDVVQTPSGDAFYLYHAYVARPGTTALGRQLMLDAIAIAPDGWPAINAGRGPSRRAPLPLLRRDGALTARAYTADFTRPLGDGWQWPHRRPLGAVTADGALALRAPRGGAGRDPLATVIARRSVEVDYTAGVTIDPAAVAPKTLVSLAAYGDRTSALGIGVRDGRIVAWSRHKRAWRETDLGAASGLVHLRLESVWGHVYRVGYSRDGEVWCSTGEVFDGRRLPPWDRAVRIALTVGGTSGASASIRAFSIAAAGGDLERLRPPAPRRIRVVRTGAATG